MSSAPVRGIVPHRQRRHHHHHHEKHQRHHDPVHNQDETNQISFQHPIQNIEKNYDCSKKEETEEKRPKVNPIFLWASQREQRIVEVRCEDYDKRNRIKLTKTAQGWRSIPRTALTAYPIMGSVIEDGNQSKKSSSTTTKNDEKENTSREKPEIKQVKVDEFETIQINNVSKVDEVQEERKKHKRKRKKQGEFSKNKKKKVNLEKEEVFGETLVSKNWKMKKRRKLDKNKKKKKLCLAEIVADKNKVDNKSEIKIKEESEKNFQSKKEVKNTKEINLTKEKEFQMCINKFDKVNTLVDSHKKSNDLEKLQKNRHLQPRVVLEQLHLSQLPTRIHRRLVSRMKLENKAEQSEGNIGNNGNEIVKKNLENDSQNNNESQIDSEIESNIHNKEDWIKMLSILDSNIVSINVDENKSNLMKSKNLVKSCTKLNHTIFQINELNDNKFHVSSNERAESENELTVIEKRNQFEQLDNIKHHIGTKSLDETIERLERSINNHKKISSVPNILTISECGFNIQKTNKIKCTVNEKVFDMNNLVNLYDPKSTIEERTLKEINTESDIIESSKILNALKNTPGLSVSLATNGKKHDDVINTISLTKKIFPTSSSPDSQTEVEKIGKYFPGISIVIPNYQHRSKTVSPISKNRVDSPESTVNFPKNEYCHYEADTCEIEEIQDCDSQVIDEIRSQNNYKRNEIKCTYENHKDSQKFLHEGGTNYAVDSTKVSNLKPLIKLIYRNSEAQAKHFGLSQYQEVDNFDEQINEEFHSYVSPQPSEMSYSLSSVRRSSSAYLERLLPSPPCSVSCSEDAKNDLTLKGILSSTNNINSKNQDKKEKIMDLSNYCESELSPSYNIPEEIFMKYLESSITNQTVANQKSQSYSQEKKKYLEMRNRRRLISSGDVQNPFEGDYITSKRPLSVEWTINQQGIKTNSEYFSNNIHYVSQEEFINKPKIYASPTIFLDPASQLRELIKTSGHLIPDPLLVPRDYLPFLAGAPLIEIPKLLTTRPELRLPEALTKPELLRDPDLLVISLAHLQHVLDYGEGSIDKSHQSNQILLSSMNINKSIKQLQDQKLLQRPKLVCKSIDKLMPAPMDLSNNQKLDSRPPLLRVRSGLLKQESEVSSTANSPDDSQLWHPLFGSQKQRQLQQKQPEQQHQQQPVSWHRTTLAS